MFGGGRGRHQPAEAEGALSRHADASTHQGAHWRTRRTALALALVAAFNGLAVLAGKSVDSVAIGYVGVGLLALITLSLANAVAGLAGRARN